MFSAHNIEHQPDFIRHLMDVESVLAPGGQFFLCIPDKRFTFDHFLPETNIADVLGAHLEGATRHSARAVIAGALLHTHNDPRRHWAGDHGSNPLHAAANPRNAAAIRQIADHYRTTTSYLDTHAWTFSPRGFAYLTKLLAEAGFTALRPMRVYETVQDSVEFYAVLGREHPTPHRPG